MILTQSQQDAITVAVGIMIFAAIFFIWPAEPEQLHDHAPEVRTPQSAESVRRWNAWLAQCQAKPKCRQRLDELMTDS